MLDRRASPAPQESFTKVIDIFLNATYNIDRLAAAAIAATEPLEDGERGVIINTASIAAYDGTIGQSAYAAAKAGIVGDDAAAGPRPGPARHPGRHHRPGHLPDAGLPQRRPGAAATPTGARRCPFPKRMGRADEYAQLAQQIAENVYLNGETIRLDGACASPQREPTSHADTLG